VRLPWKNQLSAAMHAAAIAAQAGENREAKIYARKAAKSAFSLLPSEKIRLKQLKLI